MSESIKTNVTNVYVSDLDKLAQRARAVTGKEDSEITFEFIIASLFPTSWNNIQEALRQQYIMGYTQGRKDAEEEKRHKRILNNESDYYCE